jgi:hypothetical protein
MAKRIVLATVTVLGLLLAAFSAPAVGGEAAPHSGAAERLEREREAGESESVVGLGPENSAQLASAPDLQTSLLQFPLYFIENQGQVDARVAYYVQGKDKTLYFTPQGVTFALSGSAQPSAEPRSTGDASQRWIVKLDFLAANPDVRPVGQDETGALISYFKGRPEEWKTGLRTYSKVVYRDLWPGIDLEYSGTVNRLKYQFAVGPGADPAEIRLAYRGVSGVTINGDGQLEVSTPAGGFHDDAPYAYQHTPDGEQVEVKVSYKFPSGDREPYAYGLDVGSYDQTKTLVLDPAVLVYCGFIGGSDWDVGTGIALDIYKNAYVTGWTRSTEADFPAQLAWDVTHNGDEDAFVAKVKADGSGLFYCGYIGGSEEDRASGIVVDAAGGAYIVGHTYSSESDGFPVRNGPDVTHNGGSDAFVFKVRPDGLTPVYCGYIGGEGDDIGTDIALDSSCSVYVAGSTASSEATFPEVVGPDLIHNGLDDAFVAKVMVDGTGLDYCGYIGGDNYDDGIGIAVDSSGNAYVGGETTSDQATFPESVGPDLTYNGGVSDVFVAKVRADGTDLTYCGYIGGSGQEGGGDLAVDTDDNVYITGRTGSTETQGFPLISGPDLTHNGDFDAFVAKVTADGTALTYSGYIGGSGWDSGYGVAVDADGCAYVTGDTASNEASFPVISGPDLTFNGGYYDAYVAKVNPGGTALDYCGYIGGTDWDSGHGIVLDRWRNAYVAGRTDSSHLSFPVKAGPDVTHNGSVDVFVAKVQDNHAPTLGTITPSSGSGPPDVISYFTTEWKDANGWFDLKQCYFHIGAGPSLVGNVTLLYNLPKNKMWIRSDDGSAWLGGYGIGTFQVLENSQAKVYCSLASWYGSGDTLEMTWPIEFKKAFTGYKKTGLKCKDVHKARARAEWKGDWTITS